MNPKMALTTLFSMTKQPYSKNRTNVIPVNRPPSPYYVLAAQCAMFHLLFISLELVVNKDTTSSSTGSFIQLGYIS